MKNEMIFFFFIQNLIYKRVAHKTHCQWPTEKNCIIIILLGLDQEHQACNTYSKCTNHKFTAFIEGLLIQNIYSASLKYRQNIRIVGLEAFVTVGAFVTVKFFNAFHSFGLAMSKRVNFDFILTFG